MIPSQPNKDFRRAAIELRAKTEGRTAYIPGQSGSGEDGSAKRKRELNEQEKAFLASGSHVQRIGTGIVVGGIRERASRATQDGDETPVYTSNENDTPISNDTTPAINGTYSQVSGSPNAPQDADALALQELLTATSDGPVAPKVHIIPQAESHITEDDAYRIDVETRPDSATLEDYARVPIEDFGAALLRGMKGGNRPLRAKVEAYIPKPRTALLGIGAKSREETFGTSATDGKNGTGSKGKGLSKESKRDGMRFVPLQRVERYAGSANEKGTRMDREHFEERPHTNLDRSSERRSERESHRSRSRSRDHGEKYYERDRRRRD